MMCQMVNFYDTSSFLLLDFENLNPKETVISSITLQELENLKQSNREDIKYLARRASEYLDNNFIEIVIFKNFMLNAIEAKDLEITNDTKILACAFWYENKCSPDDMIFYSNDRCLRLFANLFFGNDSIKSI